MDELLAEMDKQRLLREQAEVASKAQALAFAEEKAAFEAFKKEMDEKAKNIQNKTQGSSLQMKNEVERRVAEELMRIEQERMF